MTTNDLVTRNAEAKKNTQDAINKIIEGKTIETYVWVGFFMVVVFIAFGL